MDIFKTVRQCITRGLIENLFSVPGAKWKKSEFWTLNPVRADKSIGSFHISESGQWYDHSTKEGGDLIDLIVARDNITKKQAAEYILNQAGKPMPETKKKQKKNKPAPVIPVPENDVKKLNELLSSKWYLEKIGAVVSGWEYRDENGKLLFCVARHEKNGKKAIKPYYYSQRGRWEPGNPFKKDVPLYGLSRLSDKPVLIVEGEKCANVPVDGFSVVSWCGGTGQVKKANWKPLQDRDVIIWPDNDKPGIKAAQEIKQILPQAKILKIIKRPEKWDIYDAKQDGIDIKKFIQECEEYEIKHNTKMDNINGTPLYNYDNINYDSIPDVSSGLCDIDHDLITDNMPFKFMGFDDGGHYFLPSGSHTIKRIGQGSFTKSKLFELASLSFWLSQFPMKRGIDIDSAIDWTIRESEKKGFFQPNAVRGTGVWRDNDKIIINTGTHCVNGSGKPIKNFETKYYYVISDRKMGAFQGASATNEQGKNLIKLFQSQSFEKKVESWIACGWSLIAPFAGALKWRPHIWITGPTACGKSFLLENLIQPICGPIAEIGTGKTSAPGVYRALKSSAAPVIMDEMEPGKNKETRLRIEEKLELARNASSDFSSNMSLANKGGGVDRFCIRSPFCFSSVIPYFPGEAIENRFLICRLKNFNKAKNKRKNTKKIIDTGLMIDPGIFRRRIYKNLKTIIKNIEILRNIIYSETLNNRKADNLAPIFAALYMMTEESELDKTISESVIELLNEMESEQLESDEDKLLRYILDYQVRTRDLDSVSMAEIMLENKEDFPDEDKKNILLRHGMRIYNFSGDRKTYLAIAKNHQTLNRLLENTQYQGRYLDILKRHPAAIDKSVTIRFAGQVKGAILLDWEMLEKIYFSEEIQDLATMEIPF